MKLITFFRRRWNRVDRRLKIQRVISEQRSDDNFIAASSWFCVLSIRYLINAIIAPPQQHVDVYISANRFVNEVELEQQILLNQCWSKKIQCDAWQDKGEKWKVEDKIKIK